MSDKLTRLWVKNASDEEAVKHGCYFDIESAERVRTFLSKFCRHTKAPFAGKPFDLLPWQWERVIGPAFGWKMPDGTRRINLANVFIPKKNGKRLCIETKIPTPNGFTRMSDIKPGDKVYDESGAICSVVAVSEIETIDTCYELTFSDSTKIIAHGGHEWVTGLKCKHGKKFIVDTEYISRTIKYGSHNNHKLDLPKPLVKSDTVLPIHPYVMGYWIGNGKQNTGIVYCNWDDSNDIRNTFIECGYTGDMVKVGETHCGRMKVDGLHNTLNSCKLLNTRHIPDRYLNGSILQRKELLAGLMDSDGCCSTAGQCIFVTIHKNVADSCMALLRSLGYKPSCHIRESTSVDKDDSTLRKIHGAMYRVEFWATKDNPCFKLKRKLDRLKPSLKRGNYKHIVSCEPVPTVPTKCIQVDSPSRCYLAGEGLTITHNSTLTAGIALYLLMADYEYGAEVYLAAADRNQASIVYNEAATMAEISPALDSCLDIRRSKKMIDFRETASSIKALSADGKLNEGYNIHGLVFDELHTQPNRILWNALKFGGASRSQPLFFTISTAGELDESALWWEVFQEAIKLQESKIVDIHTLGVAYYMKDNQDWRNESVWRECNPSYGVTINPAAFKRDYDSAAKNPANESAFKRYRLNKATKHESMWVSSHYWDNCTHRGKKPLNLAMYDKVYAGLDLADSLDMNAFALVGLKKVVKHNPDDDGVNEFLEEWHYAVKLIYWIAELQLEKNDRYQQWADDGLLRVIEGPIARHEDIIFDITECLQGCKFPVEAIGIDRFSSKQLAYKLKNSLKEARLSTKLNLVGYNYSSMSEPTRKLSDAIIAGNLVHTNDPITNWQFGNIVCTKDSSGNDKLDKGSKYSKGKIDGFAAICIAIATMIEHETSKVVSKYERDTLAQKAIG